MYLHRLSLKAIGPFAGEYSIDFAELGKSGLFLLEGPTGAGKSTIIDAIVFALYGSLAGSESSSDRLHSHHAKPEIEPYVELVFETGEGIYRVRRTPSYMKPKRSGTGFTKQNASAKLESLVEPESVSGTVISTSIQEASAELTRIVGLSKLQFVQTVVLPQGEFAHFLRSTGEERRAVLQSLFGTEIYEETTRQLIEMRRLAQRTIDDARTRSELLLASFREASDQPDADAEAAGLWVKDAEALAEAALTRLAEATVKSGVAREKLEEQRTLANALATKATLETRAASANARLDEIATLKEAVAQAREAYAVEGVIRNFRQSEVRRVTAMEQLALATVDAPNAPSDSTERAKQRDLLQAELGKFGELELTEQRFPERDTWVSDEEAWLAETDEVLMRQVSEQELRPAARIVLVEDRAAKLVSASDLGEAKGALATASEQLLSLGRLAVLERDVTLAESAVKRRVGIAETAVNMERGVRLAKIRGMSGELAESLEDGVPCAVCGSLDHPRPASVEAEHPTDDDLAEAEQARTQAESDLSEARGEQSSSTALRDAAREALGDMDLERATVLRDQSKTRMQLAQKSAEQVSVLDDQLEAFDKEGELHRETQAAMRIERETRVAQLKIERASLKKDRLKITTALNGRAPAIADVIVKIRVEKDALDALIHSSEIDANSAEDLSTRQAEVDVALDATSFGSIDAAESALIAPETLAAKTSVVDAFDLELQAIEIESAAPTITALKGDEVVDVESAEADVAGTKGEAEEAAGVSALASKTSERSSKTFADFETGQLDLQTAIDASSSVMRMADVAAGVAPANPKAISLATYVLMRRFEDVIAAANARLGLMSSGRYSLEPSDERESGSRSRKLGLSLVIRDHDTDTTRDPKSFSGGETFYASLSLALGLADVVQSEAGGVEIGTLFVDEGFGSLDPDRLDTVMTELGRLSAGGRTVGIVSHVEELKQRISDRIEVRPLLGGGSSLRSTLEPASASAA